MSWLAYVLGAALAVAGAAAMINGFPYIRVEWGWTEVIAGAIGLSGGVTTIVLAAILSSLHRLRRALEEGLVSARPSEVRLELSPDAPRHDLLPEPGFAGALAENIPATGGGDPLADTIILAPEPTAAVAGQVAPLVTEGHAEPGGDEASVPKPLLKRFTWKRDKRTEPVAASPEAEVAVGADPSADKANAGAIPSGADPAESAPELPTVVGRYQAGAASYVLFSDGTIEVETETGLHRFGSMDELKQFIGSQSI